MAYEQDGREIEVDAHYDRIISERLRKDDTQSLDQAVDGLPIKKGPGGKEYLAHGPAKSFKKAPKSVDVAAGVVTDKAQLVSALSKRMELSKGSREAFSAKCEEIDKGIKSLQPASKSFEKWFEGSSLKQELVANMVRALRGPYKRTVYEPKTIKAKLLYFVEGLFIRVANWFFYRDASALFTVEEAQAPTADEKLADAIVEQMVVDHGNLTSRPDDFLSAGWRMVEATRPENVKPMPGETQAAALRRIVSECMAKYESQDANMTGTDEMAVGAPEQVLDVKPTGEVGPAGIKVFEVSSGSWEQVPFGSWDQGPKRPSDAAHGAPTGQFSQLHDKHIPLDQVRSVVSAEDDRFVHGGVNDPILRLAKQNLMKELLAKPELSEQEAKALRELTSDLGDNGVIILQE